MTFSRYAIYAAPTGRLGEMGARWLGWDVEQAKPVPHPDVPGLPMSVNELTATPRKYGFHGTLKPPFRLVEGTSREELDAALAEFVSDRSALSLDAVAAARIGGFIAMIPQGDTNALAALAGDIVTGFDHFREPPTEKELARRRAKNLSASQEANLKAWGYPYVLDEFRFHLTLTGALPENVASATIGPLSELFDPLGKPYHLNNIALFGELDSGQFKLIRRYPFPNQ